jgi:hypothetical protein
MANLRNYSTPTEYEVKYSTSTEYAVKNILRVLSML